MRAQETKKLERFEIFGVLTGVGTSHYQLPTTGLCRPGAANAASSAGESVVRMAAGFGKAGDGSLRCFVVCFGKKVCYTFRESVR